MSLKHREVSEIRLRLNNGEKGCNLAKEFGVSNAYISQIKSKKKGTKQVWLTVEEAEKLMKLLDLCVYWLSNNQVSYDCDAWASLLEKRIEQAEDEENE